MDKASVLVVDDESAVRALLALSLVNAGYAVTTASNGSEALNLVNTIPIDLMILDLNLPILAGVEVCRQVRQWSAIPIIVLSANTREEDKIAILDLGANDYVTKPFGIGELLARIRVALRSIAPQHTLKSVLTFNELCIDLAQRQVTLAGEHVYLTRKEYHLLIALAQHAGVVRSYNQLLDAVWGHETDRDLRTLRVLMGQLRRKLNETTTQQRFIFTESGIGYRFCPSSQENNSL